MTAGSPWWCCCWHAVSGDWSLATQWGTITDVGGKATATRVRPSVNAVGAVGGFAAGSHHGLPQTPLRLGRRFLCAAGMCGLAALTWFFIDCTRRISS